MVIAGIVGWLALAFGGTYASALVVPAAACLALGAAYRPALLARGPSPRLDRLLLLTLGAASLQLVPLPPTLLDWMSPAADGLARQLHLDYQGGALPISIHLQDSARGFLLLSGTLLLFATARQIFDTGGVRTTVRAIAVLGLVLAAVGIAQDATGGGRMYWRWAPLDEGPAPFGPFLNRNHFATWSIMALPLCIGYLVAHAAAHPGAAGHASRRRKIAAALDGRATLLLSAAAMLILATAVSLSRSGALGLAAALVCGGELARRHRPGSLTGAARPATAAVALGTIAVSAAFAIFARVGPAALVSRFRAADVAVADRVTIWRDTIPVLQDFWLTGTGIGTFETAMAIYQRSSPGVLFNQAHNHYLQLASEGGLLVALPASLCLLALAGQARRRLRADRSGMAWIRIGAVSGLAGVAIQSLWETGLTTPANAAMAAVLAAIAVHVPARFGPPGLR